MVGETGPSFQRKVGTSEPARRPSPGGRIGKERRQPPSSIAGYLLSVGICVTIAEPCATSSAGNLDVGRQLPTAIHGGFTSEATPDNHQRTTCGEFQTRLYEEHGPRS